MVLRIQSANNYFHIDPSFQEFFRLHTQSNRISSLTDLVTCKPKHQHDKIGNQKAVLVLILIIENTTIDSTIYSYYIIIFDFMLSLPCEVGILHPSCLAHCKFL